ncbi:MAG: hypothetical protein CM15mP65_18330 [Crocinitomicaceae bacterium]|nr:MAG: hypothetical protein CM15mP65_18330 [Crocinitomicaceae bacterium]
MTLSNKNRNVLIALIVLIKVFILIYFVFQSNHTDSFINKFISNDYSELLGPVDNLVKTGTYEYVENSNIPYAIECLDICFLTLYSGIFFLRK